MGEKPRPLTRPLIRDDRESALRDLETYLRLTPRTEADEEAKQEYEQIWEHVKNLRRRVASFN